MCRHSYSPRVSIAVSESMNERNRDFAPSASLDALEQRASLLRRLREFFYQRGFFEVETPLLASEIIPELHIEPFRVESTGTSGSPEVRPMHRRRARSMT